MAWRKRFYPRARGMYSRARSGYGRGKQWYGRNKNGSLMKWGTFGVGGVIGYFAPQVIPYQDSLVTALAILPIRMPRIVRNLAGGYVAGRIVNHALATSSGLTSLAGADSTVI